MLLRQRRLISTSATERHTLKQRARARHQRRVAIPLRSLVLRWARARPRRRKPRRPRARHRHPEL